MKKILPVFLVVIIAAGIWYFASQPSSVSAPDPKASSQSTNGSNTTSDQASNSSNNTSPNASVNLPSVTGSQDQDDQEGFEDEDTRPATELYKSSEEALQAIKNASKNYDDIVLEQFAELPANCAWCDGFYQSVTEMMTSQNFSQDERSYYAEVLAISGRVGNIKTLVESIKSSAKPEDADLYAEALELASGGDDVTSYLGGQLQGANDSLRESLAAAITNQSSRLAADILYKHTVERGDADGYYSQGIGLGEFIPDDDAIPFLQEIVLKRDQYSHLGAKALLNSGVDGLRVLFDSLENSKDPEFDEKLLRDAVDHTTYDPETEEYLKRMVQITRNPALKKFGQEAIDSFSDEGVSDADGDQFEEEE